MNRKIQPLWQHNETNSPHEEYTPLHKKHRNVDITRVDEKLGEVGKGGVKVECEFSQKIKKKKKTNLCDLLIMFFCIK